MTAGRVILPGAPPVTPHFCYFGTDVVRHPLPGMVVECGMCGRWWRRRGDDNRGWDPVRWWQRIGVRWQAWRMGVPRAQDSA